jgi:ERCC4-type nuclease
MRETHTLYAQAKSPIPIVIDDRESASGILDEIDARDEFISEVRRLPLGDFEVDGRLLFERKTLPDLVASIKDGRLFSQANRLANSDKLVALILEGTAADLTGSRMRREAIQGALISLTLFLGIPLLRARNQVETVQLMLFAARQGRTVASGALPRKGRRYRGKKRTQIHILQGLPGIGPQRAGLLLAHFGNIEAVVQASQEELQSVDGIGPDTADKIRWSVKETQTDYLADLDDDFPF